MSIIEYDRHAGGNDIRRVFAVRGGFLCVITIACVCCVSKAHGQTQSLFGSRGPVSQRGGSSGAPTTAFGRQGGFGSLDLGGGMFGGTGLGGAMNSGGSGFIGRGGTTGGLVGRRSDAQRSGLQATGRRGNSAGGNRFGGFGNFGQGRNQGRGGANFRGFGNSQRGRRRTPIRPRLQTAFSSPRLSRTTVNQTVHARLERFSVRQVAIDGLAVDLDENGQLTMRGRVASDHAKKLATAVAQLEPGVRSVRNEMLVDAADRPE